MKNKEKYFCRTCSTTIHGKAVFALHQKLCVGSNSSYPDILSNLNNYNYDRPGRERCSVHHRFRPSSDRPRRSRSVGLTKSVDQTWCNNGRASLGPVELDRSRDRKRALSIPPSTRKRAKSGSRSNQKSSSVFSQHVPSRSKTENSRVSGHTLDRLSSSRKDSSKRRSSAWKTSREPSCSSQRKKSTENGRPSRVECPYPDSRQKECRDKAISEAQRVADRLGTHGSSQPLGSSSPFGRQEIFNHSAIMRKSMDGYKPFFFDSETIPSSMEVSKRRFRGGKRGCFSCELGCSCRKCHYFTLSLVTGRQSCYLRRCHADCSCSKCHFFCQKTHSPVRLKIKDHHKSHGKSSNRNNHDNSRVSVSHNQRRSRETQPFRSEIRIDRKNGSSKNRFTESPVVRDTVRGPTSKTGSRSKRRSHSKNGSKGSRRSSVNRDGLSTSRCVSKRKLDKSDKDASGSQRDSFSPKRGREKKEVHYVCEPCGLNLHSWYSIRRHLLSSQHLQAVPKFRRSQMNMMKRRKLSLMQPPLTSVQSCSQQNWNVSDGGASSTKECLNVIQVDRGDEKTTVQPSATFPLHKNNCGVPVSLLAVPESSGFIEGASNNAHMWASDEAKMSTGAKIKGRGYSSLSADAAKDNASGCHEVAIRKFSQRHSPKKFIIRNRSKNRVPQSNTELQKSTFVRVDYKKEISAKFKENHEPDSTFKGEGGMTFEQACIDDSAYHCAKVKRHKLREPYVNLGFRCDDLGTQGSAAKVGTKRIGGRHTVRLWSSEDGDSSIRETSEKVNRMIRVDYHQKQFPVMTDVPPTDGRIMYINELDSIERMSRCSSPLEILDNGETVTQPLERLHHSENELESGGSLNTSQQAVTNDNYTTYTVDSDRFLKQLVKQLNSGGFSCQWCNNKIDGDSVMAQLYNSKGRSPNTSSPTNQCAETDIEMEDVPE